MTKFEQETYFLILDCIDNFMDSLKEKYVGVSFKLEEFYYDCWKDSYNLSENKFTVLNIRYHNGSIEYQLSCTDDDGDDVIDWVHNEYIDFEEYNERN